MSQNDWADCNATSGGKHSITKPTGKRESWGMLGFSSARRTGPSPAPWNRNSNLTGSFGHEPFHAASLVEGYPPFCLAQILGIYVWYTLSEFFDFDLANR